MIEEPQIFFLADRMDRVKGIIDTELGDVCGLQIIKGFVSC